MRTYCTKERIHAKVLSGSLGRQEKMAYQRLVEASLKTRSAKAEKGMRCDSILLHLEDK